MSKPFLCFHGPSCIVICPNSAAPPCSDFGKWLSTWVLWSLASFTFPKKGFSIGLPIRETSNGPGYRERRSPDCACPKCRHLCSDGGKTCLHHRRRIRSQ